MSFGYDSDRVNKISQIMPQFSKVAKPGDTVLMGLEGDPLFPYQDAKRPKAEILSIKERDNDYMVNLALEDGTTKEVSSMTLAADQVWEFDDSTFKNVLNREQKAYESRAEDNIEVPTSTDYRGFSEIQDLKSQVANLTQMLEDERQTAKNFHNTMIASLNEMAGDICKLDTSGNAEFCKVLNSEYSKLMNRAEGEMSDSGSESNYRGVEEDFSADETDFF